MPFAICISICEAPEEQIKLSNSQSWSNKPKDPKVRIVELPWTFWIGVIGEVRSLFACVEDTGLTPDSF